MCYHNRFWRWMAFSLKMEIVRFLKSKTDGNWPMGLRISPSLITWIYLWYRRNERQEKDLQLLLISITKQNCIIFKMSFFVRIDGCQHIFWFYWCCPLAHVWRIFFHSIAAINMSHLSCIFIHIAKLLS